MLEHFDTVSSFSVVMLLLSLLVTTLVQMILAVLGLRGSVLQWGLAKLLEQLSPQLKPHAAVLAGAVLKHPMIQHLAGRRATSIRKEELVRLLDDLVAGGAGGLSAEARTALGKVLATRAPELAAAAAELKAAMKKEFPQDAAQVQQVIDRTLADTRKAVTDLGVWFDTVMDRTTENFLLKTRWVTVGVTIVVAFVLHVDSLGILRQLSSQPEVRARIAQSAEATLEQAENALARNAGQPAMASAAIADALSRLGTRREIPPVQSVPANLVTREEGAAWIDATLGGSTNRDAVRAAYGTAFEERTRMWLDGLRRSAEDLGSTLKTSELTVVPSPLPPWRDYVVRPGHLLGTLMTVLFLSLGAPFWYNVLRQLSNLRPAVAQKIEPKSLSGR